MILPKVTTDEVTFTCVSCNKEIPVKVNGADYIYWRYNRQDLVQNIFPHLTPDERELLISGMCGKCYDELFQDDEEDL